MNPSSRWKEALVLLSAGAQIVPLGNNREVYRRLSERLECLRRPAKPAHAPCEPASPDVQEWWRN